jgi:hypothetical protein
MYTPPQEIIDLAYQRIKEEGFDVENWDEDAWIDVSDEWDVNIWVDDLTGDRRACLFPISKGTTQVEFFFDLPI